jgi:hypothetical protein
MATARVISVSTGHAAGASWAAALKRTAIDERPVATAGPAAVPGPAGAWLAAAVRAAAAPG